MITDAIMGILIYGDSSLRQGYTENKETFIRQLRSLRACQNDGSYGEFDAAVRIILREFRSSKPNTQVALWVNEVVTLLATELPAPAIQPVPAVEERGKVLQFVPRKR